MQVILLGQADSTSTWLPAEKIPSMIIEEYKNDITYQVEEVVTSHSGQHLHTLHTTVGD